jgi:hypothetical protein
VTWRESREKAALLTGVVEEGVHTGRKKNRRRRVGGAADPWKRRCPSPTRVCVASTVSKVAKTSRLD